MARLIQQIQKDLTELERKVAELAVELNSLYRKYLEAFSQSAKQQLILASYQICTHVYPEAFLKLSFSQRETLQKKLKEIGDRIKTRLLDLLEQPSNTPQATITEQMLLHLTNAGEQLFQIPETEPENSTIKIFNPEELVYWCKKIEHGISEILEEISQSVNEHLHQAHILPPQLPPKILEMALQAEEEGIAIGNSPNILNLLVETQEEQEEAKDGSVEKEPQITKLAALNLRLSEIEFVDPSLSNERKEIRILLERLSKIWQIYRKLQRERAIAEAESAWRASWHEG